MYSWVYSPLPVGHNHTLDRARRSLWRMLPTPEALATSHPLRTAGNVLEASAAVVAVAVFEAGSA